MDPRFVADLYFSTTTNTPTEFLVAAHFNTPFSLTTGGGGGYFLGGTKTLASVPAGTAIEAQVRVWDSYYGSTWESARAISGLDGRSSPVIITVGLTNTPGNLFGLQSFKLGFLGAVIGILNQPLTQTAAVGSSLLLNVKAQHLYTPPLSSFFYQWSFEGSPLAGATRSELRLPNVQTSQSGGYQVIVSDVLGSKASQTASVSVVPALAAPLVPALIISNGVGSNFVLDYSADLGPMIWLTLASLSPTNSPQIYFDVSAPDGSARFYRLRQTP